MDEVPMRLEDSVTAKHARQFHWLSFPRNENAHHSIPLYKILRSCVCVSVCTYLQLYTHMHMYQLQWSLYKWSTCLKQPASPGPNNTNTLHSTSASTATCPQQPGEEVPQVTGLTRQVPQVTGLIRQSHRWPVWLDKFHRWPVWLDSPTGDRSD